MNSYQKRDCCEEWVFTQPVSRRAPVNKDVIDGLSDSLSMEALQLLLPYPTM